MNVISLMRCRQVWNTARCSSVTGVLPGVGGTESPAARQVLPRARPVPAHSLFPTRSLSWSLFGSRNKSNSDGQDSDSENGDDASSSDPSNTTAVKTEIQLSPYTINTVISAERAKHFYLLEQGHLDQLESVLPIRSAYASGDREQMYPLSAVQAKSIEVWGSLSNLHDQQRRRQDLLDAEEMRQQIMRAFHHKTTKRKPPLTNKFDITSHHCRVILYAICGNSLVCALKTGAYVWTGSHSMLAESFHSAFDVVNQSLLLLGYYKSCSSPSYDHPYGHTRQIYVYGLFSGFSLFFIGGLYNIYTGSLAFLEPHGLESLHLAFLMLTGSFVVEGATCYQAFRRVSQLSREAGLSFFSYVQHGSESNSIHVLTEDFFSICGLSIASLSLLISHYSGNAMWDAGGMVLIGGLLTLASFSIIRRNQNMLVGKSIQPQVLSKIIELLEEDRIISSVHDTKGVVIGANAISFKAEILIDGRELAALTIARHADTNSYFKSMTNLSSDIQRQQFLHRFATDMTNELGEHIDFVEKAIKAKFPSVRHIDLEIL
ncbi:proton-coupled zinc antiporter SLC30A9, mitochondrial-like [Sycon ciliatum]|uniref:proton-coupled zinc antiporter SLC30A9, mitochondrial-like n=1 Tax=Sycon ciliatum TaxID=27933 RepID=UPI0020AADA2A|eukprot:scpid51547/ scgid34349/ Zinc transporter 9; Solute carrier family 30 member 9